MIWLLLAIPMVFACLAVATLVLALIDLGMIEQPDPDKREPD